MSKPLSIDPAVLRRLQRLPKSERIECLLALCDLPDSFGRPHLHSGLGIRKLGTKLLEWRGTVALRFIYQDRPSDLFVSFLDNHDEIKGLLRRGRYR